MLSLCAAPIRSTGLWVLRVSGTYCRAAHNSLQVYLLSTRLVQQTFLTCTGHRINDAIMQLSS